MLVGLTDQAAALLLNRLKRTGADPARAVRDGQLIIVDQRGTDELYATPTQRVGDQLVSHALAAVRDGYRGIRFAGLSLGTVLSPHEHTLNQVVRQYPATCLCLYSAQAPATVLDAAATLHDPWTPPTPPFPQGDRPLPPGPDMASRTGFPVPGQSAPALMVNLIWRTFGSRRPGPAESVLDWVGLLDQPAQPAAEVASRHRITRATLTNQVRQVHRRGNQTPLTPLQLRDATRPSYPSEDPLSRHRITQLLGLPPQQDTN